MNLLNNWLEIGMKSTLIRTKRRTPKVPHPAIHRCARPALESLAAWLEPATPRGRCRPVPFGSAGSAVRTVWETKEMFFSPAKHIDALDLCVCWLHSGRFSGPRVFAFLPRRFHQWIWDYFHWIGLKFLSVNFELFRKKNVLIFLNFKFHFWTNFKINLNHLNVWIFAH